MKKAFPVRAIFPKLLVVIAILLSWNRIYCQSPRFSLDLKNENVPPIFTKLVEKIEFDGIGTNGIIMEVKQVADDMIKIRLNFQIKDSIRLDDWQINIHPSFKADFHWASHLTPTDDHIIAQHVFRSPVVIMGEKSSNSQMVLMPDLDVLAKNDEVKWYMDMDASKNTMTLGLSDYSVKEHVLFIRKKGSKFPPGIFSVSFFLLAHNDAESMRDPWREPAAFLWNHWGAPLYNSGQPIQGNLDTYLNHTYEWAFGTWQKNVWQEFSVNKTKVGAPVFIVNITQSPNYPGPVDEREFRSIWNQAWFSSLRSASGLFRYARRIHNDSLLDKAKMTKELALLFPQKNGLFYSIIATPMKQVEIDGKKYNRSVGWDHYYWGNSDRNPFSKPAQEAPFHILDMSWTAGQMMDWYNELEKDPRLLSYSTKYADRLISLQDENGFFPGWLDVKSQKPMGILDQSAETSASVSFLLKIYNATREKKYFDAASKAMDAVINHIIPFSKWEDFETYYSCSSVFDSLVNKKITRNDSYKQNTLSIYWTAAALFDLYQITRDRKFLDVGQRVLDELLMYQASWQPPYIFINALGGFGVMNADGEWNDSRQSLFAELIIQYGKELNIEEYTQRGIAALKASFVMMYCPENPKTKIQWEKKWPFFNQLDYGFMMENYGHGGETGAEGIGIGEFTIYDWGNGAAAEAYNRIVDHFGRELIK